MQDESRIGSDTGPFGHSALRMLQGTLGWVRCQKAPLLRCPCFREACAIRKTHRLPATQATSTASAYPSRTRKLPSNQQSACATQPGQFQVVLSNETFPLHVIE